MNTNSESRLKTTLDFDAELQEYHFAAAEFVKGNPEGYKNLFSHREEVTLINPFGPAKRGWRQVSESLDAASSQYRDGKITFESLARSFTADIAYVVEIEHFEVKIGESRDVTPVDLAITRILKPEDGSWKIVHLHASRQPLTV